MVTITHLATRKSRQNFIAILGYSFPPILMTVFSNLLILMNESYNCLFLTVHITER